jgi:S1-C subfamily serine protease
MALFYLGKNFTKDYASFSSTQSQTSDSYRSISLQSDYYIVAFQYGNFTGTSMDITNNIADVFKYFPDGIGSFYFKRKLDPASVYSLAVDACSSFTAISRNDNIYSCSGFFVTKDGYLATAAHCVLSDDIDPSTNRPVPLEKFYVSVTNVNKTNVNKILPARLAGYDNVTDVAVLKVSGLTDQDYLQWGSSEQTSIGSEVYALGNPLGVDDDSFSYGHVRDNEYKGELPNFGVESILTDVTIISGNSGGPLLNPICKVIGLSNYGIGKTSNLGGGVSQKTAQPIIENIIQNDLSSVNKTSSSISRLFTSEGAKINAYMGFDLIQVPSYISVNINDGVADGGLVVDVDSSMINVLNMYDSVHKIDGKQVGRYANMFTPVSILSSKCPGDVIEIEYRKRSEKYSKLYKMNIILLQRVKNVSSTDDKSAEIHSILLKDF